MEANHEKPCPKLQQFALADDTGTKPDFQVIKKEIVDPGLLDRQIVRYGDYDPYIRYTIQLKDIIPAMGYKAYTSSGRMP